MFIGGVSYYKPYDLDSTNILTLSAGFSRKVLQLVASQRISTLLLKYPLLELFDKNIVVVKTQRIDRASLGRVVYDRVQAMTRTYLF